MYADLLLKYNWYENKSVSLSIIALLGQGELGLWGDWGPSIFSPTVKKSSLRTCFHTNIFNYTFDTREIEFMVEEVVIGTKENAKPLVGFRPATSAEL